MADQEELDVVKQETSAEDTMLDLIAANTAGIYQNSHQSTDLFALQQSNKWSAPYIGIYSGGQAAILPGNSLEYLLDTHLAGLQESSADEGPPFPQHHFTAHLVGLQESLTATTQHSISPGAPPHPAPPSLTPEWNNDSTFFWDLENQMATWPVRNPQAREPYSQAEVLRFMEALPEVTLSELDDNSRVCRICWGSYGKDVSLDDGNLEKAVRLPPPCNHVYGYLCLKKLLSPKSVGGWEKRDCPLCRREIVVSEGSAADDGIRPENPEL